MRRFPPFLARVSRAATLLGALLPAACGGPEPAAPPAPPGRGYGLDGALPAGVAVPERRPSVLLIVIDTLRGDALSGPGGEPTDMPVLTRLARNGVTFTQASSGCSWTLPSMTSLLTGRLPTQHRITGEEGLTTGLAAGTTWAEVLAQGLGYDTTAWIGEPWPGGKGSMFEGFESVAPVGSLQGVPTVLTYWARHRSPAQPFFALLHTYEAHDPYGSRNHPFPARGVSRQESDEALARLGPNPSPRTLTRSLVLSTAVRDAIMRGAEHADALSAFTRYIWTGWRDAPDPELAGEMRQEYRAGVRWVDGLLEDAVASFQRAGLLRDTLVIVTGDHGEAFGEHGMLLHGRTLYDELLRVPLVLIGPPPFDGGKTIHASVSLLDLFPTILEWLGLPPMQGLPGRSLLPLLAAPSQGRPVVAQVVRGARHTDGLDDAEVESVRSTTWKFILTQDRRSGALREELFDLSTDPGELHDLAADPAALARLAADEAFSSTVREVRARHPLRPSATPPPNEGGR